MQRFMHNFVSHIILRYFHQLCRFLFFSDEPPKVINQPKSLNEVCPEVDVSFTIQATGTKPLSYQWQWKPTKEKSGSEDWKQCPAEWSNGATLTIPNVQKSDEGYYCCIISNCAGEQTSCPAELSLGKNLKNICYCVKCVSLPLFFSV